MSLTSLFLLGFVSLLISSVLVVYQSRVILRKSHTDKPIRMVDQALQLGGLAMMTASVLFLVGVTAYLLK